MLGGADNSNGELGMRTISWTALSFQPALLAVHFGTDGTQR